MEYLIFLGTTDFCGKLTFKFDTKGLILSNLYQSSSNYACQYIYCFKGWSWIWMPLFVLLSLDILKCTFRNNWLLSVEIFLVTHWWAVQPLDWRRWDSLISSYVVVGVLDKRRVLSLYGCNLLIYVMILPCSLQKPLTRNQTLFNVLIHILTYHSRSLTRVSYLVQ